MRNYQGKAQAGERMGESLTRLTRLPGETIARLLECGAVQVRFRAKGPWSRVRDARLKMDPSDEIKVSHDAKVLALPAFSEVQAVEENRNYGVYMKPAGIVSQGTDAGDHCSLLYAIQKRGKEPFPVHRLDRETEGLMVVAFNPRAAAQLSRLFQEHLVQKTYLAIVAGETSYLGVGTEGVFDDPLDGKKAETRYRVVRELEEGRKLLELKPITGRLHQIRRHLELVDCGVWGDPKYGKRNKNKVGMKLAAVELSFQDPWSQEVRRFRSPASFASSP